MGSEFLRRIFGRKPVPSSEVMEALDELARLARQRPALAEAASTLGDLLPFLFEQSGVSGEFTIPPDRAESKRAAGVPLLRGEVVQLDLAVLARRWEQVSAVIEKSRHGPIADALQNRALDLGDLIAHVQAGRTDAIYEQANALGLDAGLLATVLRLTLLPAWSALHGEASPQRGGHGWNRGYCPMCGSWPFLGEFRGLEQTRFLRCGLCASEWEHPRLCCPYCATTDHHELGYFFAEAEEGQYRAATCSHCNRYVKMISTLATLTPARLLVADVATLHLDLAAADRGLEWQ